MDPTPYSSLSGHCKHLVTKVIKVEHITTAGTEISSIIPLMKETHEALNQKNQTRKM